MIKRNIVRSEQILSYRKIMTQASFYRDSQSNNPQGVYFEIPQNQLAKELHKRKQEEHSRLLKADKLVNENQELKELKLKIQQGYLNKERSKQMAEKQVRRVDQLVQDAEYEVEIFRKRQEEERRLYHIQQEKSYQRMQGKEVLKKQMQEKVDKEKEAYDQYLREKDQVESVMKTLLDSEMKELAERGTKKKKAYQDMQMALELKEEKRRDEADLIKRENQKYMAYVKELDGREETVKKVKEEKEQAKDKIFQKLKGEEEKRRRDVDELDTLRRQLYQEEYEADARRREYEESAKRESQRQQMMDAQRQARERKRLQRLEEEHMEQEFRGTMLRKFADQDRVEQMAQQKRRMKEHEHKREVERMWQERLQVYRLEKERQEHDYRRIQEDKNWEEEVIRREKEKLLKQHLPNLEGFLPKDLAKASGTLNRLERTNFSEKFKL